MLVPMYPEGEPDSMSVQEMLHWQYLTMDSMYRRIATAIHDFGRQSEFGPGPAHPTDYLSFYCMAKQESREDQPSGLQEPRPGSLPADLRRQCHSLIYTHAKLAIFDDDYVVVGSANVNQRSMDGGRDTDQGTAL